MKIDLNQPISNPLPPTERAVHSSTSGAQAQRGAASTISNPPPGTGDVTATLTSAARDITNLTSVVASATEVRHSRIEGLRNSIEQGTYQVSPERIADAMLAQAISKTR